MDPLLGDVSATDGAAPEETVTEAADDDSIVRYLVSIAYWQTRTFFKQRRRAQSLPAELLQVRQDVAPPDAEIQVNERKQLVFEAVAALRRAELRLVVAGAVPV